VPLVLGFILGPLAEKSLLQAYKIQKSGLNIILAMMKRPICIVLIVVIAYILISSFRKSMKNEKQE
jgi:TctA family transporter